MRFPFSRLNEGTVVLIPACIAITAVLVASAIAGGKGPQANGDATHGPVLTVDRTMVFDAQEFTHPKTGAVTDRGQIHFTQVFASGVNEGQTQADWVGNVDCYHQDGNEAWFSGTIDTVNSVLLPNPGNAFFSAYVVDNQAGGSGDTPDAFALRRASTAFNCENEDTSQTVATHTGNITVHDG